jgi:hypothetical protein
VPLRDVLGSSPAAQRAHADALAALDGATDDSLRTIRQRLSRPRPSVNIHWSEDTGKLLIIDMM